VDRRAILGNDDLEDLGLLVCGSVVPGGGEEAGIVGGFEVSHELRHELFRGHTAETLVLR
jgi:hypothetical protein